jgi:hypothetical protein
MSGFPQAVSPNQVPNGIVIPKGWGVNTKAAKSAAIGKTGIWRVGWAGDSVHRGGYVSNPVVFGYEALVRAFYQGIYGDGGSGYFSPEFSQTWGVGVGTFPAAWNSISPSIYTTESNFPFYSIASPGFIGYSASAIGGTVTSPPTTSTNQLRGRYLYLFDAGGGSGTGGFSYSVDGGAVSGTVPASGTAHLFRVTGPIDMLTSGTHTLVITSLTASCFVNGWVCQNALGGMVSYNFGANGQKSGLYNNQAGTSAFQVGAAAGGYLFPCDTLIWEMTVNDANAGTAADSVIQNLQWEMQGVVDSLAGGSPLATTDIVLLLHHIGNFDSASPVYAQYMARLYAFAQSIGAAVVDMWAYWRMSWNYAQANNYWCSTVPDGTGNPGSNTIHLSNSGHAVVAQQLETVLSAA